MLAVVQEDACVRPERGLQLDEDHAPFARVDAPAIACICICIWIWMGVVLGTYHGAKLDESLGKAKLSQHAVLAHSSLAARVKEELERIGGRIFAADASSAGPKGGRVDEKVRERRWFCVGLRIGSLAVAAAAAAAATGVRVERGG